MQIRTRITGTEGALRRLTRISRRVRTRGERRMVTRGSVPIQRAQKALAPRRTGTMKKAIGKRVKRGRQGGGFFAVIGPRRKFRRQIGTRQRGRNAGQPIIHDPAKVAHLVEGGHGGPHAAAPHPFAGPSLAQGQAEAQRVMAQVAWEEVRKAAG